MTGAGKHTVLGECIGKTVHSAVCGTLALQNKLSPENQRSVLVHLERFGLSEDRLREDTAAFFLDGADANVFRANFSCIERDPLVVAAMAALAHLRDKVTWGILPQSCVPELAATYGAQIASAVSGDCSRLADYRDMLADGNYRLENVDLPRLVARAMALGFRDKWRELHLPGYREPQQSTMENPELGEESQTL